MTRPPSGKGSISPDEGQPSTSSSVSALPVLDVSALAARPDQLRRYIDMGGDLRVQDDAGMTLLHHAVASGHRESVRALVASNRCDYLIQDKLGRYASDIAVEWARDYAVARLLSKHQVRQAQELGVPGYVSPGGEAG